MKNNDTSECDVKVVGPYCVCVFFKLRSKIIIVYLELFVSVFDGLFEFDVLLLSDVSRVLSNAQLLLKLTYRATELSDVECLVLQLS